MGGREKTLKGGRVSDGLGKWKKVLTGQCKVERGL